jgi:hypothetical protein
MIYFDCCEKNTSTLMSLLKKNKSFSEFSQGGGENDLGCWNCNNRCVCRKIISGHFKSFKTFYTEHIENYYYYYYSAEK